jgi:eukaryotic-like serine/threonine-protein kinase
MGEVRLAEQKVPIHRTVALKLIKAGMDTKAVVARFESERQALALMDHPNIARVYDAGSTPEGRPYFVMEYVPGLPITEYCDKHRFTVKERLGLFMQVCDGAQHAHQKAIIHRDLKPSNVLVVEQDNKAAPKIIDFGLAKATGQRLTDKTMFTELGVMIGTPEYMSPEQADQREQNIDTRTDVYSLGVILYQLLVGVLPFETKALRAQGMEAILRMIREQEPPKPSTKIRSMGPAFTASAEKRRNHGRSRGTCKGSSTGSP